MARLCMATASLGAVLFSCALSQRGAAEISEALTQKSEESSLSVVPHQVQIKIEGMQFNPATVRIQEGDIVTFQNNDLVPHTATAEKPNGFDSDLIKAGGTWSTKLAMPGVLHYSCKFHPTMKGEIIVAPAAAG